MVTTEPLPCGDLRTARRTGCRVCTLYATDAKYRAAFDAEPIPDGVRDSRDCLHLGTPVRRAGQVRDWRTCGHPATPLGNPVCVCRGCGPKCKGYVAGRAAGEDG